MLKKFSMKNSKKGLLPIFHDFNFSKDMCSKTEDEKACRNRMPYVSAIDSMIYFLLCSRPDASYTLNVTSRYQANSDDGHSMAVKNIFKYLRRTKVIILIYGRDNLQLEGYTDANFQSNKDDSKCQFEYVFTLNSFKYETTADSTTKVEYIVATEVAKEAI